LTTLSVGKFLVDVVRKDIKNSHLSVYPPNGFVRISVPKSSSDAAIASLIASKTAWIEKQQRSLRAAMREPERKVVDRETHFVWGSPHLLKLVDSRDGQVTGVREGRLQLVVNTNSTFEERKRRLDSWYRDQLRHFALLRLEYWQARMNLSGKTLKIQSMKTRWGSCNPTSQTIRLNLELAKRSKRCTDYLLVHELVHLKHPGHGPLFQEELSRVLPGWKDIKAELDSGVLSHQTWKY
jgi:predicted metal-dependent hydrolase